MSVDIESWVHRQVFNIPPAEQTRELDNGHVLKSTRIILELFRKYNTKATFFVLGSVAEWYPELIEEMKQDGHEIGIHGYSHKRLNYHTKESFDEEIEKTSALLKGHGVTPLGYRSPAFSTADFLYEVLDTHGIKYDSSIFPVKTPLYDGTAYDCHPFIIDRDILEIPCSVFKVGNIRIPAGGFYLRLLGSRINHILLNKIEKQYGIAIVYFHPWEVLDIPQDIRLGSGDKVSLPFLKKRFAYYKIPMLRQLEYLLGELEFTNIEASRRIIEKQATR